MYHRGTRLVTGLLILGLSGGALAQGSDHELITMESNPDIVSGELPNGFVYHIDTGAEQSPTVELRLKIDVGSLDESEDELGYAHFIEHMAFNGTEQYPGQELTDYLKSTGMDFGGDINAHTGFDETVYKLSIPIDQPDLVAQGFDVMAQWAEHIEFTESEVEAEKGVIIEEWRMDMAGDPPVWLQQLEARYQGTDYADRLPIGTLESIQNASADKLESLYRRYYQADRMTFYVSGTTSAKEIQAHIERAFTDLPSGAAPELNRPRVDYADNLVTVNSDENVSKGHAGQARNIQQEPLHTVKGQKLDFFSGLLAKAFEERIEQWRNNNPGRADIHVRPSKLLDDSYATELVLHPTGDVSDKDVLVLQKLWRQAIEHGISKDEYQLYGDRMINEFDRLISNVPDMSASDRLWLIQYLYDGEEILFDLDSYLNATRELFNHYDQNSFNAWLRDLGNAPAYTKVVVPQSQMDSWSPEELKQTLSTHSMEAVDQPKLAFADETAVRPNTLAGTLVESADTSMGGLKKLALSNGLSVWFYPTDVESNRVIVNLVSRGGLAVNSPTDAALKMFWAPVLNETALFGLGRTGFDDWKNQQGITGGADTRLHLSGLYWDGKPQSLDTLLAVTAHQMQPVELNETIIGEYVNGTRSYLSGYWSTPEGIKEKALQPYTIDHPGLVTIAEPLLNEVTPEALERFHQNWLGMGTNTELFVVGNVEESALIDALEVTIAGVPLPETIEGQLDPVTWSGQQRLQIPAHSEDKTEVKIRIRAREPMWRQDKRIAAQVASKVLAEYLMNEVRENQGDSYSIGAYMDQAEPSIPTTELIISTSTDPKQADSVIATVSGALESPEDWATAKLLNNAIKQLTEDYRQDAKGLDTLLRKIKFYTRADRTLADYDRYPDLVESVDIEQVHQLLREFSTSQQRLTVTVEPKV